MPAEELAEGVGRNVVDLHGKNQVEQVAVGIAGVGQERQMAEHPADVQETQDRQSDRLKLTLGAVAKDGDQQDGGDHVRRAGPQTGRTSRASATCGSYIIETRPMATMPR